MRDSQMFNARVVSSVAATIISLACGTNYVYSAWAPQFADRLHLTATESEFIGLAGNLGMYSMGVPLGMFVDSRGPRPAVILGAFLMGLGYWPMHSAYEAGSGSVVLLCILSFITGIGGCLAFAAAVKTSALNWPDHRGTATAFPLAAFGLSAFFFSLVSTILFPGSPSKFLELLAGGTFGMAFSGFFFLGVYPPSKSQQYEDGGDNTGLEEEGVGLMDSQELHQKPSRLPGSKSHRGERAMHSVDHGTSSTNATISEPHQPGRVDVRSLAEEKEEDQEEDEDTETGQLHSHDYDHDLTKQPRPQPEHNETLGAAVTGKENDETSSLMPHSRRSSCESSSSSLSLSSLSVPADVKTSRVDMDPSELVDIRGMALLKSLEFWQLFIIMGILAGIGLMTINNIGNDSTALFKHWDDSIDDKTLVLEQQLHVSILSLGSFTGRLLSGIGSDFLVKVLSASRLWCLVAASFIFGLAQLFALQLTNPHMLGLVSGLSGLGYGFLFGVYPSIVAESFGVRGLSQNWGFMTLSPVLSSNVFNLFYGAVFDRHSVVEPDGKRRCEDGVECYRSAYVLTLVSCALGLAVTMWVIWDQRRKERRGMGGGRKARLED